MNTSVSIPMFAVATAAVLGASVSGCATSTEARRAPVGVGAPSEARCRAFHGDDAVNSILSGDAVEEVGPLYSGYESKTSHRQLEGAVLTVRPTKGATSEWLERGLQCYGAGEWAAGGEVGARRVDPFSLPHGSVEIHVRSAGDGFAIQLSGANGADARAILERAVSFGDGRRTASLPPQ